MGGIEDLESPQVQIKRGPGIKSCQLGRACIYFFLYTAVLTYVVCQLKRQHLITGKPFLAIANCLFKTDIR